MKLPQSFTTVTPLSKVLAILLFVSLPFIGFYFGYLFGSSNSSLVTVTPSEEQKPATATIPPEEVKNTIINEPEYIGEVEPDKKGYGVIEGSLSYGSEHIPELTVCAENVTTQKVYCRKKNIFDIKKFTYGEGYQLQVPEGFYKVYVMTVNDYVYYSDFVVCGHPKCPSHDPIVIRVNSGETISKIDPDDWYDQ